MLARYGEHSGYELLKLAESGVAYLWSPAKSHLYDGLPRLKRSGHARRRIVAQTGTPDKHLWRITPRGHRALTTWVNTVDSDSLSNRGVFLLKIFFGDHGDRERLVPHLEDFRAQAEAKLADLRAIERQPMVSPDDELPLITLRQGLAGTEAQLRWSQEALVQLRARAARRSAAAGLPAPQ